MQIDIIFAKVENTNHDKFYICKTCFLFVFLVSDGLNTEIAASAAISVLFSIEKCLIYTFFEEFILFRSLFPDPGILTFSPSSPSV